jgi:hypothetical protein
MTKILYRGRRGNKEWVFGNLRDRKMFGDTLIGDLFSNMNWQVQKDTIGQYTGLDDKKGVKIFEGDIVEYEDSNRSCLNRDDGKDITQIVWDDGALVLADGYPKHLGEYGGEVFEVIGNIHDNPELLEEKENDKDT